MRTEYTVQIRGEDGSWRHLLPSVSIGRLVVTTEGDAEVLLERVRERYPDRGARIVSRNISEWEEVG